ncbi:MAG TPA: helix-hairpin-helix domain-containing protein, partial [Candidatus Coatesbacteria bacterium]|nr:helix-hairpin-helix domain-containing protein [Candidatus Coatesbacteria bacterium]
MGRAEAAAVAALALAAALFIALDPPRPPPAEEETAVSYAFLFGDALARPGAYPFLRGKPPELAYIYRRAGGEPSLAAFLPKVAPGLPAVFWFDRAWLESRAGPAGPLDLNRAPLHELVTLPGIGEVLARRIIAGRPYSSVDELKRVEG